jgi:hypothetical protein
VNILQETAEVHLCFAYSHADLAHADHSNVTIVVTLHTITRSYICQPKPARIRKGGFISGNSRVCGDAAEAAAGLGKGAKPEATDGLKYETGDGRIVFHP